MIRAPPIMSVGGVDGACGTWGEGHAVSGGGAERLENPAGLAYGDSPAGRDGAGDAEMISCVTGIAICNMWRLFGGCDFGAELQNEQRMPGSRKRGGWCNKCCWLNKWCVLFEGLTLRINSECVGGAECACCACLCWSGRSAWGRDRGPGGRVGGWSYWISLFHALYILTVCV